MIQPHQTQKLKDEQQGHGDGEALFPGLVMEQAHPQQQTQAPAQGGGEQQRPLRDAPGPLFRPALVHAAEDKGAQAHESQIGGQDAFHSKMGPRAARAISAMTRQASAL